MDELINSTVNNIKLSGIRKFFNLVNEKDGILSLTIGQPDFTTPSIVKQDAIQAIEQNKTTYTSNAGLPELRQAVSDYMNEKYKINYDKEHILITVGASQAIDIACRTILSSGDEVILPDPVYPGYQPLIELAGATPIHVDTTNTNYKLTASLIESHINDKTKCVILPYPSNPTGVSLSEDELREIANLIQKYDIYLITDEIYSALTYEDEHFSIAQIDSIKDRVIVINGLSKSHAMTGWRIGFLLAPEHLATHFTKVLQYNVSCASSISQYAALSAVTKAKNQPDVMKESYRKRRDYVLERLHQMGIKTVYPDGAFYVMFALSTEKSTFDLALDLVESAQLALVPGDAFGQAGEGLLRLSYAYSMETLKTGLDRLATYVEINNNQS
ncbi:aminotransferase [Pelagirhabdus alkalitolerans]|uniref:Aminotransferase n=1 Tax=Pelagirhabdus alkalitolerans TaxID=1612202 RepID=A0A1G6GZC1_9BACI|nr:aminotransferase A [Pelagirhabdus alkalitolerans]SDB87025.1 aminotransferase [Pelagirhabdus alkalitolerans]